MSSVAADPGRERLPSSPSPEPPEQRSWSTAKLVAWRFAFVYLVLFTLAFPIGHLLHVAGWTWLGDRWDAAHHAIAVWVGEHVLRLAEPIPLGPGSDSMSRYVQIVCMAALAVLASALWTAVDRRANHTRLDDWLRVLVRYALGFVMFSYGMVKVLTTQFPAPTPDLLAKELGEFSPALLMWTFMGQSTAYCVFTGAAEVMGGLLLFWRRTTALGSLVTIGVMSNVVMLNICYDVPVKLFSTHLLLMAVFLVAPYARGIADVLLERAPRSGRSQPPRTSTPLGPAGRVARAVLLVAGLSWMTYRHHESWHAPHPKPALYGFYDVEAFERVGATGPAEAWERARWQTVHVTPAPSLRIRQVDGALVRLGLADDPARRAITLTPFDGGPSQVLRYSRPDAAHLLLEGDFGGQAIRVRLRLRDPGATNLLRHHVRWINDHGSFDM